MEEAIQRDVVDTLRGTILLQETMDLHTPIHHQSDSNTFSRTLRCVPTANFSFLIYNLLFGRTTLIWCHVGKNGIRESDDQTRERDLSYEMMLLA